ncbi:hypothetical protein [Arachidicoccus soli]|uniref:Uncharacterized protein n=1 Tax=Arachidicoccus soli TaxID=2341117 RepID=A0A386HLG1_9BACT|nr:hypothetical protein [Arachidicoccus soli]AYD46738.1 hypothetical protein D6B99_03360 [Arachidicoccus soli]
MIYKKIRYFTIAVICLSKAIPSVAQNNTSPYSMLGIGNIVNNYFDRSSGMANSGISLSSAHNMYEANPASLPFLNDHYFNLELAGNFSSIKYLGTPILQPTTTNELQVQRVEMGIKVEPFWGFSFGLSQYSSSNYSFNGQKNVIGSDIFVPTYTEGSGGINEVSVSNGFRIGRNFSFGIKSSYLFGSLQQDESISANSITSAQLNTKVLQNYKHLYFEGGLQYKIPINAKWQLSLGAIASNKTNLNGSRSVGITQGDPSVSAPTVILADSITNTSTFTLPVTYGGGLSLKFDNKITFAADYKTQRWNNVHNNLANAAYSLQNSNNYSAGIEFAKNKTVVINNGLYNYEKYFFQVGGFYTQEYLNIRGQQITNKGATFGVGVNAMRSSLGYMFNFQVGTRGTQINNLIKENYFQLGIVVTFKDLWQTHAPRYN